MTTLELLTMSRFDVTSSDGLCHCRQTLAELRARKVDEAAILSGVKTFLLARVDAEAETLRAGYLTPGTGQVMEYQEARAEAVAALASPSAATPALYPMLAATIGIDIDPQSGAPAADVLGVARAVNGSYAAFLAAGAAIRAARKKGKTAIEAATTIAAAAAAFDAIAWLAAAG